MKTLNNLFVTNNKQTKIILKTEEGNYYITLKRNKNDVYGNPLYRITIHDNKFNNKISLLRGLIYKCYNKGYGLIQSYNLQNDLQHIFNKIFDKNWQVEEIYEEIY